MRLCDLREKEVINTGNCRRLGCVVDLVVDMKKGCVQAIVVPGPGRLCGLFGYDSEYVIPFECICKVGPDIILVDIRFWRKDGTSDEMSILRQSGHKSD